jgi:beta-glucosidase
MPWLDKVAGVVEAWYAGSAGHKALANILLGDVNPSGKLAMTFPVREADLPRPSIAPLPPNDEGQGHYAVNSETRVSSYAVHYDEGSEVGYKWYEAQHKQPLFPFGFGLSYTSYSYSGLSVDSSTKTARFTVKNTGRRTGTEIAEVYATLPKEADESFKRLVGWKRVTLAPGESQEVTVTIDPQELQTFDESKNTWMLTNGEYGVLVGSSSASTPLRASLRIH